MPTLKTCSPKGINPVFLGLTVILQQLTDNTTHPTWLSFEPLLLPNRRSRVFLMVLWFQGLLGNSTGVFSCSFKVKRGDRPEEWRKGNGARTHQLTTLSCFTVSGISVHAGQLHNDYTLYKGQHNLVDWRIRKIFYDSKCVFFSCFLFSIYLESRCVWNLNIRDSAIVFLIFPRCKLGENTIVFNRWNKIIYLTTCDGRCVATLDRWFEQENLWSSMSFTPQE